MTAAPTTTIPETEILADVQKFANYCIYMRGIFEHLNTLYETSDAAEKKLMHDAAPIFFQDLNHILVEYVIQQICKITDPAEQRFKNKVVVNHTVEFFVKNADFATAPEKLDRLKELQAAMDRFRDKLKPARDKLISHLDRDAVLADANLGAALTSDWDAFWADLQEFVAILHERYIGHSLKINSVGMLSDADTLIKALRHGAHFDAIIHSDDKALAKRCMQVAFGN